MKEELHRRLKGYASAVSTDDRMRSAWHERQFELVGVRNWLDDKLKETGA